MKMGNKKKKNSNSRSKRLIRLYTEPSFLIVLIILLFASVFMSVTIEGFSRLVKKVPLPPKKPLEQLDEAYLERMGGYRVESKEKIGNEQIVKELGTEEYIQWVLVDTKAPVDSTIRKCSLFITYYEMPDRVPHVPDECYIGVGYQRMGRENIELTVAENEKEKVLSGRYVVFGSPTELNSSGYSPAGSNKFAVMYLFRVNEQYCGTREAARIALDKNMFQKHSFFSKVEWKFYNDLGGVLTYPTKTQALKASDKMLTVILTLLEKEHWPEEAG